MQPLPFLKPGDQVEILAPASRCSDKQLSQLQALLTSWGLICHTPSDLFGDDLLCANTDEIRFELLKKALLNPNIKAIICVRGGYGSMRLIPLLAQLLKPPAMKLFVGMSDITALHLYFQQEWHWPVIHGSLTQDKFSPESIARLKALLFGEISRIDGVGIPLNRCAQKKHSLSAPIVGGNLCLVQSSLGTPWQIQTKNKIIFLEEVGERGYRVDRMLEHLKQAKVFEQACAIIFGDFTEGTEPNGTSLIEPVLARFAQGCTIPVVQMKGIGHGYINFPLPLGLPSILQLGEKAKLSITMSS